MSNIHVAGQVEDLSEYGIEPGDMEVVYTVDELKQLLIPVRKGLHLYNSYYTKTAVEEGMGLYFLDDPAGKKFDLEIYGDMGVFGAQSSATGKLLAKIFPTLSAFVAKDGYKIHGIRPDGGYGSFMGLFGDRIEEFAFLFNKDYKLKRLVIFTEECGEIPIVYEEEALDLDGALNGKEPWNDRTAMAYLVQLGAMERDLTAREPMGWLEFIKLYTYPAIYDEINQGYSNTEASTDVLWGGASCAAEALEDELKQLGEDIFSGDFSIVDAFAERFNENLCSDDVDDVLAKETKLFQMEDPNDPNAGQQSVSAMAKAQAFETIEQDDAVFEDLCTAILNLEFGGPKDWWNALSEIKLCGLTDAQKDALSCLMGEVTLEEALSAIAERALLAMSVENFGDLFIGLPADKQAELDALVQQKFENGEFFAPGTSGQALSDTIAASGDTALIDGAWSGSSYFTANTYTKTKVKEHRGGITTTIYRTGIDLDSRTKSIEAEENLTRRTLIQQFDFAATAAEEMDPNTVVGAYIIALMEVYDDSLMELISELNKFPGTELIISSVEAIDCPTTPLLNPTVFEWINDRELPLCRTTDPLAFPWFTNPASWIPQVFDIPRVLMEALKYALQQAIFYVLTQIFVKICEILGGAACSALGAGGQALASLADGERSKMVDAIRDSICGPDADAQTIDDTLVDLVGSLGVGPSVAFANADQVLSLMEDISSAVTTEELYGALLGDPSQDFLNITYTILKWDEDYEPLREGLRNKAQIASLFAGVGNCMPAGFKVQMKAMLEYFPDPGQSPTPLGITPPTESSPLLPANPSLCLTDEQIEAFNDLRSQILDGRASDAQIAKFGASSGEAWEGAGPPGADGSAPGLNPRSPKGPFLKPSEDEDTGEDLNPGSSTGGGVLDDLEDVVEILVNGPSAYIADNLPPLLSKPGCDDGLLPYETEEAAAVATSALNGLLEQLKVDLAYDMMGNGPGEANWGMMNMILSDTMGFPYTAHQRQAARGAWGWVNYYVNPDTGVDFDDEEEAASAGAADSYPTFKDQRGAYPYKVAAWLEDFINDGKAFPGAFESNNSSLTRTWDETFDEAGLTNFNGHFEYRQITGLEYNTQVTAHLDSDIPSGGYYTFIEKTRKKTPDYTLAYYDNIAGLYYDQRFGNTVYEDGATDTKTYLQAIADLSAAAEEGDEQKYDYMDGEELDSCTSCNSTAMLRSTGNLPVGTIFEAGCEIDVYIADLIEDDDGTVRNRAGDNMRVKISDMAAANPNTWTKIAATLPKAWAIKGGLRGGIYKAVVTSGDGYGWFGKANNDEDNLGRISKDWKYEFLSTDPTLDNIDLSAYPKFLACFERHQTYTPPVVLLDELTGRLGDDIGSLKDSYDEIYGAMVKTILAEVGGNEAAFLYGASYDDLTYADIEYVLGQDAIDTFSGNNPLIDADGVDATASTLYRDAEIWDVEDEEYRGIKNSDQIMGTSAMEAGGSQNNRVVYLDPAIFGGTYMNPPLYIKPVETTGWLGFMDVLFPEMSPCKPYRTDLIDFGDVQEQVNDNYPTIPEDERLKSDPDCIVEVPYARILDRAALSGLESVITSAIRIYVSSFFIRAIATFTKFSPKFPDVFSSVCASFVIEEMEAAFKDAQRPAWELFNPFKDNDFWYSFLEQSVQLYSRRVDSGDITDPPQAVIDALVRLNDMQEEYLYANKEDVKDARDAGEFKKRKYKGKYGLKNYRQHQNLNAVAETAEDAKLALKELVMEQLNQMGEKFVENLKIIGMAPDVFDMDYYALEALSQGSTLDLAHEIRATYVDLPSYDGNTLINADDSDNHYTSGGEFALPDGSEYVGYYHVEQAFSAIYDSDTSYRTGASSGRAVEYEILTPFASLTTVPIGDIEWVGFSADTDSITQPFVVEKYIKVNNSYRDYDEAFVDFADDTIGYGYDYDDEGNIIDTYAVSGPDLTKNVSDIYPGTLKFVTDDTGNVVGLEGKLGVRHGLRFSLLLGGTQYTITEVEVDSLDVALEKVDPLKEDSKLLLCLVNMLKEDDKFKLITQYIFGLKKTLGVGAIYNALTFLPSIGEKVAGDNETFGDHSVIGYKKWFKKTFEDKIAPGVSIQFFREATDDESASDPLYFTDDEDTGNPFMRLDPPEITDSLANPGAWTSKLDRDPGIFGGLFVKEWDSWDQELLRNSRARVKKIFKSYYNARDFSPGESTSESPGAIISEEFKARFRGRPGQNLLPWWKRRLLRTNPFNADGELCEEKD